MCVDEYDAGFAGLIAVLVDLQQLMAICASMFPNLIASRLGLDPGQRAGTLSILHARTILQFLL
jgi:hypothetical protein